MCEDCREQKKEIQEELRQLVAGEGELYEKLSEAALVEYDDEQVREDALDCVVAEGIAQRAAMVAQNCTNTPTHNTPIFMILGAWAHDLMQSEMRAKREHYLRNFLGMGEN
jgi:hypothetical protein